MAGWSPQPAVGCSHFRAPTTDVRDGLLKAEAAFEPLPSTIHGAEGQEFPAVAPAPPASIRKDATGRTVLDDREFGFSSFHS